MPTNDFKPWAIGGGANVEAQATYAADPAVGVGETSGTASSTRANKVWRQASIACYSLGQIIVDVLGLDALDDTNISTFLANLKQAIVNLAWTTGDVKLTYKTAADSGWVLATDGTIGSASSGATFASASAAALYSLIWTNVSNSFAPVTGGRGGSSAADFAANKPMALPKALGMALAVAGAGSGLTARSLGQFMNPSTTPKGEESHTLTLPEVPGTILVNSGAGTVQQPGSFPANANAGGSQAHNNMQPTTFVNVMIKL